MWKSLQDRNLSWSLKDKSQSVPSTEQNTIVRQRTKAFRVSKGHSRSPKDQKLLKLRICLAHRGPKLFQNNFDSLKYQNLLKFPINFGRILSLEIFLEIQMNENLSGTSKDRILSSRDDHFHGYPKNRNLICNNSCI